MHSLLPDDRDRGNAGIFPKVNPTRGAEEKDGTAHHQLCMKGRGA